jgi:aminotransferase
MINVFQPNVGDEELKAIAEVFESAWLGHGPRVDTFEHEFAEHLGVNPEQVLFLNSATSGLFLATELLRLGPGDEVVLPTVSFVANANAIVATGARPVFCDVDARTLNPSVADIEAVATPRTKAVMVLHYGGHPGDIAGIAAWCRAREVALIEDAACAVASSVHGTACGTFGDIGVWSFDSRKVITTGDGGLVYLRDPDLVRQARRLAYHGQDSRSAFSVAATAQRPSRRWWEQSIHAIGRRLIGNDLTAALGSVQLRRLPGFLERRSSLTATYDRLLAGAEGIRRPPRPPTGHVTSHYFYWVQLDPALRDGVAEDLLARGIYTSFRYVPLHGVPLYRSDARLPSADEAAATTLLLPLHPGLTNADVEHVVRELRAAVERGRRVRA